MASNAPDYNTIVLIYSLMFVKPLSTTLTCFISLPKTYKAYTYIQYTPVETSAVVTCLRMFQGKGSNRDEQIDIGIKFQYILIYVPYEVWGICSFIKKALNYIILCNAVMLHSIWQLAT